jgi:hypothetical protein
MAWRIEKLDEANCRSPGVPPDFPKGPKGFFGDFSGSVLREITLPKEGEVFSFTSQMIIPH